MTEIGPKRVFLSYARNDDDPDYHDPNKSFMRRLYNDLIAAGYDVWWDREHMPSRGLTFLDEIRDAITASRRLILVVGEHAVKSDYVTDEWLHALKCCIPVIPIMRNGDYSIIPDKLKFAHAPDFRDDTYYATKLVELKRILDEPDTTLAMLHDVPQLPPSYIERNVTTHISARLLQDSKKPLVVTTQQAPNIVHGLGGIGKTVLASAIVRLCDVRRAFPDGVFWVQIGNEETPNLVPALAAIGMAFGDVMDCYNDLDATQAKLRLSSLLQGKRVLIVLDDVWDYRHVEHFRIGEARLLITTRQGGMVGQLDAHGEELETLTMQEGLELIAQRLSKKDKFVQPDDLPPECAEIVMVLGGHTLAVSLAAAKLDKRGMGHAPDLLERLQALEKDAGTLFNKGDKTLNLHDEDKNLNLEKSLSLSYDDLDDDLRRCWRALGVFAPGGTFDHEMVMQVWSKTNKYAADDHLEVLTDAGLIQVTGDNRFKQHSLLRAYAYTFLIQHNELDAVFLLYADDVIERAIQFETLKREGWKQLDPFLPHVDYMGNRLVECNQAKPNDVIFHRYLSDFAYNVTNYVYHRPQMIDAVQGRVLRGLSWLEAGLQVSQKQDDKRRAAFLANAIGLVRSNNGEKHKALGHFDESVSLYRMIGDLSGAAQAMDNIGKTHGELGEVLQAQRDYEQAFHLWNEIENYSKAAYTLNHIGKILSVLGKTEKALENYKHAFELFIRVDDTAGKAYTLRSIGHLLCQQGKVKDAKDYYEQSLALWRHVDNHTGEAATLTSLGNIWGMLCEAEKELECYKQALIARRVVGDPVGIAVALSILGRFHFRHGNIDHSIDITKEIIEINERSGAIPQVAAAHYNMAILLKSKGDITEAIQHAQTGRDLLVYHELPIAANGISQDKYNEFITSLKENLS